MPHIPILQAKLHTATQSTAIAAQPAHINSMCILALTMNFKFQIFIIYIHGIIAD